MIVSMREMTPKLEKVLSVRGVGGGSGSNGCVAHIRRAEGCGKERG